MLQMDYIIGNTYLLLTYSCFKRCFNNGFQQFGVYPSCVHENIFQKIIPKTLANS